jgi:hypothetical protein
MLDRKLIELERLIAQIQRDIAALSKIVRDLAFAIEVERGNDVRRRS